VHINVLARNILQAVDSGSTCHCADSLEPSGYVVYACRLSLAAYKAAEQLAPARPYLVIRMLKQFNSSAQRSIAALEKPLNGSQNGLPALIVQGRIRHHFD
jgi:hypothetical protein